MKCNEKSGLEDLRHNSKVTVLGMNPTAVPQLHSTRTLKGPVPSSQPQNIPFPSHDYRMLHEVTAQMEGSGSGLFTENNLF